MKSLLGVTKDMAKGKGKAGEADQDEVMNKLDELIDDDSKGGKGEGKKGARVEGKAGKGKE